MGVADIADPEVAVIIILYNPTGEGGHQGGSVAAPIASQVLRRSTAIFRNFKKRRSKRNSNNAKCRRNDN